MRAAIVVSLGTSILLGSGALLIARAWAPSGKPAAPAFLAPAATIPVLVTRAALAYGDRVTPDKLKVAQFPAGLAPQGAFASMAQLTQGAAGSPVALVAMAPGEPILPAKVSGPGARSSVAVQIAPGMRAYAVKITNETGVGGHALPGDRVDVVLARSLPGRSKTPGDVVLISDIVAQDVRLLGVNLNSDPTSTASAATSELRTATLEVSLQDAQKLAVAADAGTLSLALRRTGSSEMIAARQVRVADLGDDAAPRNPEPGLARIGRRRPAERPNQSSVMIVQGEHDASVSVPVDARGGA